MPFTFLLLTGAVIAGALAGPAASWKGIETTRDGSYKLYLDTAQIVRNGSTRLFIARMLPNGASDPTDPSAIGSVLAMVKIDCRANTIETRAATLIDQSGETSDLGSDPARAIQPGTDDVALRESVCQAHHSKAVPTSARRRHM